MTAMPGGATFVLALLCAAAMGLAIQRGGTCMVAAVHELVHERRPTRLLAMAEAALWVSAGLLLARQLGVTMALPQGHALTAWTVAGAVLLGLGAVVNGACVVGTVARLGRGQWAYAATPIGFYLGCVGVNTLFTMPAMPPAVEPSPLLGAPGWVACTIVALLVARGLAGLWRHRASLSNAWSPHAATAVIGVAFVALLLLSGAWAYTDVLADLARGATRDLPTRLAFDAALLAGALAGGWWRGRLGRRRVNASQVLQCAAGGALMAAGSLLIPGSNDALLLIGLPLLWTYAWVAAAVMAATLALVLHPGWGAKPTLP
jgi:Sulphur transport